MTDAQGETALHAAVRASNTSAARQLMLAGADARARSLAGVTPCELARAARDNERVGLGCNGHGDDSGSAGGGMAQWLGRMNPYHLRVTIVTIRNVDWLWFLGAPILMPMTWSRYSKERLGARDVEQVCRIVCKAAVARQGS